LDGAIDQISNIKCIEFMDVKIYTCVSDIVQEDVDALVSIQNRHLNPSTSISERIWMSGGEELM